MRLEQQGKSKQQRQQRRRRRRLLKRGGKISLKGIIGRVARALKEFNPVETSATNVKTGLALARHYVREAGGKRKIRVTVPRVLPVSKIGGFLFTIPAIFGALSAIGALSGGAAGIAKAVNDAKGATKQLEENKRHNKAMETIAIKTPITTRHGLYLKPYRSGLGLYFMTQPKKIFFFTKVTTTCFNQF